jgi:restriction endonuclease S subunit
MPGLNMDIIKNLLIPKAPLPLQQRFDQVVQRSDRLHLQRQEVLRLAESHFLTQQHHSFQGTLELGSENIRIVNAEESAVYPTYNQHFQDEKETPVYQLSLLGD